MSIELIRGELERLYSLEEMLSLSSELLGFEPVQVGGTASTATFARALTEHCAKHDAIAALIDAVTGTKNDASPKLRKAVEEVLRAPVELKAGDNIGGFTIARKIGVGPNGTVYAVKRDGESLILKLLHNAAVHDKTALFRYLTRTRLLHRIDVPELPRKLEAGFVEGRPYVAYESFEAKPLAPRVARTGALHINEARPLLHAILNALRAIHEAKMVHGAVKLENVLIGKNEDGSPRIVLIDAGGDMLGSSWIHSDVATTGGNRIKGLAPEQLKGLGTTPQSDMYGFGALLFEVLTGKPPLEEETATDLAVAHLSKEPAKAAELAPRGWVSQELSELCSRLLSKNPAGRPAIVEVLGVLGPIDKPKEAITDEDLDDCVDSLVADPTDPEAAINLELTLERGADVRKVADAFMMAADQISPDEMAQAAAVGEESEAVATAKSDAARDRGNDIRKGLLFRSARLYGSQLKDHAKAEEIYHTILDLVPNDEVAQTGFEDALRAQEKIEELVEFLLQLSEKSDSHSERGRALNKIGHLYFGPLDDSEQAVFAFAQALSQDVQNEEFANDLERAASANMQLWAEAMRTLHEVTEHPRLPEEVRISLFLRLGRWYESKISRPDLALPCFEQVLHLDPANQDSLEAMQQVYRRAQQWNELVTVLLTRAERAPTPERRRDIRTEAAEILDTRLDDLGRARDLYEQTLKEDPGHQKTVDALARIYQRNQDWSGYVQILQRQAEALVGGARAETLSRIAELYEDQLHDQAEAERQYQAALDIDTTSVTALRGLDRVYSKAGRYKELLENLETQISLAATPRQKINLHERIAGIYDEEFLDHEKSSEALERVLHLDPSHEGALTALMRHYRALDRWDEVIELYDRSLKVCEDDERRVQLLLAQGRVLLDFGSPERARMVYEHVLQLDPSNGSALEALAQVRAATGDALAALSAVESLAEKAESPAQRADLWIRAARILEEHGDREGAISRYKQALDAQPDHKEAGDGLRKAYLARGDAASAAELVVEEIKRTEGKMSKARLFTELAELRRSKLADVEGAREAATKAIDLDPTNMGALLLLGDIAFDGEAFNEAATHYGALAKRVEALDKADAKRILQRYIDALARSGSTKQAKDTVKFLLELAPDDPAALRRAARVLLDAGDAARSAELYARLLAEFSKALGDEKGPAMLEYGRALRLSDAHDKAVEVLSEAADLMPDAVQPILELTQTYEATGKWEEVVAIKQRRLDLAEGDERANLLLELGEILANNVKDATRAAKTFVAALEERPDDRRVLTRLMKLYSEEKDWGKLVEVVLKLGEGIDDAKQKAKYVHTAAGVAARQLGDLDNAVRYLDKVLDLDPDNDKALLELVDLREQKGDYDGVIFSLNMVMERAEKANDKDTVIKTLDRMGNLFEEKLGFAEEAVEHYERAQGLDPNNPKRSERLAKLYSADSSKYLDKAIEAQMDIARKNPFSAESYRQLRKLFTEAKQADPAWCCCQALYVLNVAEPDEERFYRRMRPDNAAEARERISDEDWATILTHESCDPVVTAIFQHIQPAILARNAQPLEATGYQPAYALDLAMHPVPMSQMLYYAGGVLGMDLPMTFQNPNDPGGISFLHAKPPCIVLGQAALAAELPTQAGAFIAARHLTYYRPGFYIRHLVPTGTGLRSWLFAAVKLVVESFPVSAELESTVVENVATLRQVIMGPARDQLTSAVTKLIQSGSIDLKKWVAGVDLSADRAGFLVAHDLEVACEMIKASDEATAAVPHRDRTKELTLFSVSSKYFRLRKKLAITIDS